MKTVIHSFSNFHEQIQILNQEKEDLKIELGKSKKEKQNLKNKIKLLEKKLKNLNNSSFSKK
jgi:predicted  nucleic acid-binding Zn-ribbon protein